MKPVLIVLSPLSQCLQPLLSCNLALCNGWSCGQFSMSKDFVVMEESYCGTEVNEVYVSL